MYIIYIYVCIYIYIYIYNLLVEIVDLTPILTCPYKACCARWYALSGKSRARDAYDILLPTRSRHFSIFYYIPIYIYICLSLSLYIYIYIVHTY